LDTDKQKAHIRMDNKEVSMDSVRYELEADNPGVQMMTKLLSSIMQPYVVNDTADYKYNVCR